MVPQVLKDLPFRRPGSSTTKDIIILNGRKYIEADTHSISFSISGSFIAEVSSPVDRSAKCGMAGEDVHLLETAGKCANVRGINNHGYVLPL